MSEPTLHPDLAGHASELLRAHPHLSDGFAVTAGCYVLNDGVSFLEHGVTRVPQFVLKVAAGDGQVSENTVSFDSLTLDSAAVVPLLAMEERADAVLDDQAAIDALLSPYGTLGAQWAAAVATAPDRAALFGVPLADTRPPPGAPSDDPTVLHAWLARHFTYAPGGGDYYAKWGPDGAAGVFPDDTTTEYREHATVEHILDRAQVYALIVETAPEASAEGSFSATETLIRISPVSDADPIVDVLAETSRRESSALREVVIFHAADGRGIPVPPAARGTLRPELAMVGDGVLQPTVEPLVQPRTTSDGSATGTLKVSAVVRPGTFIGDDIPALPEGVEYLGGLPEDDDVDAVPAEGDEDAAADSQQEHVRYFSAPLNRLVDLAAHEDIATLSVVHVSTPFVDVARSTINQATYLTNLAVPPADAGKGVVIGVVDTGIDGQHPAFTGRIEAVWDQLIGTDPAHPHPTGRANNFGQVWDTAADIQANSTDEAGHGTHVAGIAAGAPGGSFTSTGLAPAATLVIVKGLGPGSDNDRIRRGVEWCFRQAGRRPCVVNLSLGHQSHGHDGVDDFSLSIRRTYRRQNAARDGFEWIAGRAVCTAAGNDGDKRGHTHVASLAPAATASMPLTIASRTTSLGALVTPSSAFVDLFARPLPRAVRGCRVDVRVRLASGAAQTPWFTFNAAGNTQQSMLGTALVRVINGPSPRTDLGLTFTQHQHVIIAVDQVGGLPAGQYILDVRNQSAVDVEAHAYLPGTLQNRQGDPVFFSNDTRRSTVGSPATAYGTVRVGAMVNRTSWRPQGAPADGSGDIPNDEVVMDPATNLWFGTTTSPAVGDLAVFSDSGPVRGTTRTLTAMLPGDGVFSALTSLAMASPNNTLFGSTDIIDGTTGQMTGTSMATPVATGLVACLLQKHPSMTALEVTKRMREAAGPPPLVWDAIAFGDGPTDAALIDVG